MQQMGLGRGGRSRAHSAKHLKDQLEMKNGEHPLYLISICLLLFRAMVGVGLSVLHQSIFEATLANQLEPQELSDGKV